MFGGSQWGPMPTGVENLLESFLQASELVVKLLWCEILVTERALDGIQERGHCAHYWLLPLVDCFVVCDSSKNHEGIHVLLCILILTLALVLALAPEEEEEEEHFHAEEKKVEEEEANKDENVDQAFASFCAIYKALSHELRKMWEKDGNSLHDLKLMSIKMDKTWAKELDK